MTAASDTARYLNHQGRAKIRIKFSKAGKIRFVSHRDVARLFERALRKLRLPVAYSEGFSPRPKLSFGLALSVAHESDAEYLDVELEQLVALEALPPRLTEALPDGISVVGVAMLEPGAESLQQAITSCTWHIETLDVPPAEMEVAVASVLAAAELPHERVRKGKTTVTDVRPAILELEVMGPTENGVQLAAHLATETVSLRPTELVEVLAAALSTSRGDTEQSPGPTEGRVRRTHQWMTVDGARCEPVSTPGAATGHELQRAS